MVEGNEQNPLTRDVTILKNLENFRQVVTIA